MAKRYGKRRFKKRSYKKKRLSKKTSPLVRQSRLFRHKCTGVIPVTVGNPSSNTRHDFTFARFDFESSLLSSVYGVNSAPRFNQVRKNYEEFAVTGLSVQFNPCNIDGQIDPSNNNRVGGAIQAIFSFDDVDTYDTSGYTDQ